MNTGQSFDCDLLVIGSGAAGLSTAVTAAVLGLDVVVIEKEAQPVAPRLGRADGCGSRATR